MMAGLPEPPRGARRRRLAKRAVIACVAAAVAGVLVMGWLAQAPAPTESAVAMRPSSRPGPPWIYGAPEGRYTMELYADLECPYCKHAVPQLLRWVDSQPEVRIQWHHLPLSFHDPAATRAAALVECVGRQGSPSTFWTAVQWYYAHTRGNGQGLPPNARPLPSADVGDCLSDPTVQSSIHADAQSAMVDGITATPAVRIEDRKTGNHLLLYGEVEADALLSALDRISEMPASP